MLRLERRRLEDTGVLLTTLWRERAEGVADAGPHRRAELVTHTWEERLAANREDHRDMRMPMPGLGCGTTRSSSVDAALQNDESPDEPSGLPAFNSTNTSSALLLVDAI